MSASTTREAVFEALFLALSEAPQKELQNLHDAVESYRKMFPRTAQRIATRQPSPLVFDFFEAMDEAFAYCCLDVDGDNAEA